MSKYSRARVAVVAVAALAGAGLVPLVAATTAAAVEPTAVTIDHPALNVAADGTATFNASLTGASGQPLHQVFAAITSGPDADAAAPLTGTWCTAGPDWAFTCDITNGVNNPEGPRSGVDQIVIFYDAAGTHSYQAASDPSAKATLTIGGSVNSVALTPTTSHVGVGSYRAYTVSAVDASGRPVVGTSLTVTATEKNADGTAVAAGTLNVTGTDPGAGAVFSGGGSATGTAMTSTCWYHAFPIRSDVSAEVAMRASSGSRYCTRTPSRSSMRIR